MRASLFWGVTASCLLPLTLGLPSEPQLAARDTAAAAAAPATASAAAATNYGPGCSPSKLLVRQEWNTLSNAQKSNYISAVLCLQKKPPRFPKSFAPGVRSRFDDFVAIHINQTLTIHYTATFLSWHRYFTWIYEQALRNECGYTGTQPYWNWGQYAQDPTQNPMFSGSSVSLSGDGQYIPNHPGQVLSLPGFPDVDLPPGKGGGCVKTGPFASMSVNLGPVVYPTGTGNITQGLQYNPRCLKRDLNPYCSQHWTTPGNITYLIDHWQTVADFQFNMQGIPGSGALGVHGGGHYTIGGDPGGDFFVSPGDPAFYAHHSMIDRVWWLWQQKDPATRTYQISGTGTFLNEPPSANVTLDDTIDMAVLGPTYKIRDLMSITQGPFCYTYI
jgi:tyrosinase